MDLVPALVVGLGLPAFALAVGLAWRARQGRVRRIDGPSDAPSTPDAAAAARDADRLGLDATALGADATIVQFSTVFCSRCPATARALGGLASDYDAVRHVDIDLTHRPELAAAFAVTQTPTVLVLDAGGRAAARVAGAPRIDDLREVIDSMTGRSRVPHHA